MNIWDKRRIAEDFIETLLRLDLPFGREYPEQLTEFTMKEMFSVYQ